MKLDASDIHDLEPVIAAVARHVLAEIRADEARHGDKIAYRQEEAAGLIGVPMTTLRDARLRGEITGTKAGRYVIYAREELMRFTTRNQI